MPVSETGSLRRRNTGPETAQLRDWGSVRGGTVRCQRCPGPSPGPARRLERTRCHTRHQNEIRQKRSSMVRFLAAYDEPDDPDAFDRHYREVHIPLAKKLPGLRRYTVSCNPTPTRDREAYYLIAEL